jgi:hypothetical protein
MNSILDNFTKEKSLVYIVIGAIILVTVIVVYLFIYYGGKSLEITSPLGGEEWEIGKTYNITWKARGIDRVGIALFNGTEVRWIAENVNAEAEKYDWKVYSDQGHGGGFWIAVFEYPWQEENVIDYAKGAVAITYSSLSSCDVLSLENEWLYMASDFPGLRRVFITDESYKGDLGGLDGADKKCQEEAETLKLGGDWMAFLGGEDDDETAVNRLKKSPRGENGIFVEAISAGKLDRGSTCHRLLGSNFDEFLEKFSNSKIINVDKIGTNFLKEMVDVWLGRVNENSRKQCTVITFRLFTNKPLYETYSLTTTCYNWTIGDEFVQGYPVDTTKPKPTFPTCYTPSGNKTDAVSLAGLSSGIEGVGKEETLTYSQGKECAVAKKLICIEK